MVLKPGHFGMWIRSTSAILNCGVGERCTRSVEPDRVKNEEINEENIPLTMKPRRRNYLLKHITEENIEGTGRRVRRCKQIMDDLNETRGHWKLEEG
jgi:hypothetical protein